jgi:hypothetical protein
MKHTVFPYRPQASGVVAPPRRSASCLPPADHRLGLRDNRPSDGIHRSEGPLFFEQPSAMGRFLVVAASDSTVTKVLGDEKLTQNWQSRVGR